ncbi:MAG: ABC transporter ATP-binding protein [Planctomycetota bacterium]|jgi:ABC-2 type transport system ATP-binding protein
MKAPILEVQNLAKYFTVGGSMGRQLLALFRGKQTIAALKGVSFRVDAGEILGVVGPNGAGKTTLLRILADLLEPDGGGVVFCGEKLNGGKSGFRGKIGYVSSDERSFFWRLTGRQNLEFFSRLYGIPKAVSRARIAAMLRAFGLDGKADELFRDYSTGTRKKFSLIRALLHKPLLILLDEVTNSLDPASACAVRSLAREYVCAGEGRAGIWSSHRLEEVREVCDKAIVINHGLVKFFGSVCELKAGYEQNAGYYELMQKNGGASCLLDALFGDSGRVPGWRREMNHGNC